MRKHCCTCAAVLWSRARSQYQSFASQAGGYIIHTSFVHEGVATLFHMAPCRALVGHCCCWVRRPGQFQTAYDTCLASARRGGACAGVMFWDVVHHVRSRTRPNLPR